jgi:Tfp pilus assembly PilM family ATPase
MSAFFSLGSRRRIAIDLGGSAIKVLLAEPSPDGLKILRHHLLDLREEALFTPEEISRQLRTIIQEMGSCHIALNLPQHLAIAQVANLPPVSGPEVRKLIEEETIQLSGLSDSSVVYDYCALKPFGKYQNPYWVSIARENDIHQQIGRLLVPESALSKITTPANALIGACAAFHPELPDVLLVDLGAHSTTVVAIHDGQGVFVSSFPIGSESFTEAIAAQQRCSFEEAENIKRTQDLFRGDHQLPGFAAVVQNWFQDLEKVVGEWRASNPELTPPQPVPLLLSGGGIRQPGLVDYVRTIAPSEGRTWPALPLQGAVDLPMDQFAVACGIALDAFGQNPQHTSLLPSKLRAARLRLRQVAPVNAACGLLLGLLAVVLAFGSWQKFDLIRHKQQLTGEAQEALEHAAAIRTIARNLEHQYERVRPVIERHHHTMQTLEALNALQHSRSKQNLWYVLFADQQSYSFGATVPPPREPDPQAPLQPERLAPLPRNVLIAELSIPQKGEAALKTLSETVAQLNELPALRNVDSLPASQRRALVDPAVIIPDQHYALQIELRGLPIQPPTLTPQPEPRPATNRVRRTGAPAPPAGIPPSRQPPAPNGT